MPLRCMLLPRYTSRRGRSIRAVIAPRPAGRTLLLLEARGLTRPLERVLGAFGSATTDDGVT
jgi:hypothetical protein